MSALICDDAISKKDRAFVENIIVPVSSIDSGAVTRQSREFDFEGYPRWEADGKIYYSFPEPETPQQYAHNTLLKHFEQKTGANYIEDGYMVEQMEGSAKVAVDAVRLWAMINNRISCAMACSETEHLAITAIMAFAARGVPELTDAELVANVARLALPDVSKLRWGEIVAIKKHGEFATLRDKIKELYSERAEYGATARALTEEARRLSRRIAINAEPKPVRALFELIATNLPIGLVNPYSVFVGYKKFLSDCREGSRNKWIYAFLDLEERVERWS